MENKTLIKEEDLKIYSYLADNYRNDKEKYPVVTLCGSTRFKDEFYKVAEELTKCGFIVIMPSVFNNKETKELLDIETKNKLIKMHKQRIGMSSCIFVVNVDGYIGDNTMEEIKYAKENMKYVFYLHK